MFKYIILSSRANIIAAIVVLALSILIVAASYMYRGIEDQNKQLANQELQSARARYQLAKTNTEILQKFQTKYKQLLTKQIVDSEDRLSWVSAMEMAVNKNLITSVQYKIDKQEKYNDPGLVRGFPDIEVLSSSMNIEMELLHEGDLYAFFNELKNNVKGFFEIKSCDLSAPAKSAGTVLDEVSDSNLKARCNINWYSIKVRGI